MNETTKNVRGYLLSGASLFDIREHLSEDGIKPDSIKTAISQALESFEEVGEISEDTIKGWRIECIRELYRKMQEAGDYTGALAALKELGKSEQPRTKAPEIDEPLEL